MASLSLPPPTRLTGISTFELMNERIDKRQCLLMGIKSLIKDETRSQPI